MHFRLRVPRGTIKLKTYRYLRRREIERKVPVWRLGGVYLIWWPQSADNSQ